MASLRRELGEFRAATAAARVSKEAGRQQLTRMMDEQLAQNQTVETLRRQVETSNNTARDAQALLRAHHEQQSLQSRMPPPTNYPVAKGGIITNIPLVPSLSTPSTGMRTRELHGPGYYHVGYAEQMHAMYGRDGTHRGMIHHPVDHPPEDPVVKLLMTLNGKADLVRMFRLSRVTE